MEPDADEQILLDGDTLLLCSDGLTRMVTDPEIASTLMTVEPAQAAADRLVELANEYGGEDNVTAIVVRARAGSERHLGAAAAMAANTTRSGNIALLGGSLKWRRLLLKFDSAVLQRGPARQPAGDHRPRAGQRHGDR